MSTIINADPYGRIALQGYDPVAFHTDGQARKGDPGVEAIYEGYKYFFSSDESRAIFKEDPERYLPAFGGYCAYGASIDVLAPVEIDTWEIIDNRLVLQFSSGAKELFDRDQAASLKEAERGFAALAEKCCAEPLA